MEDRFGDFKIFSGFEGMGKCWWCGGEFPDKRHRRYCKEDCRDEYYRHFWWTSAVRWALERACHKCEICGAKSDKMAYYATLEVHHIEPLNNETRHMNIKNRPENLIVLCRSCHGKAHTKPKYKSNQMAMELL